MDLLTKFLNVLPPLHNSKERERQLQDHAEHQVGPSVHYTSYM